VILQDEWIWQGGRWTEKHALFNTDQVNINEMQCSNKLQFDLIVLCCFLVFSQVVAVMVSLNGRIHD
jgi:hypothetical protein